MTAPADGRYLEVERQLRNAAPHALLDVTRAELARRFGATDVDLLMADYAVTMLQPVSVLPYTARPVPVGTSEPGKSFGAQQPRVERVSSGVVVHLPVTVRGDRLGVLSVGLPQAPDDVVLDALAQIAEVLAHEIMVAERDTDLYLQARRANRLTLAAEMQWQLLPGRACARAEYSIGAQLEPAYAIYGDNFDWSTSADRLTLTVTNGMGEGIDAALLTNLAVNALRNARRAGTPLADQAALADQAVYGQYEGRLHVSVLLLEFDLTTGDVEVVDAGSPRMWLLRDGTAEPVDFDAQMPLGMFDGTPYTAERFRVVPRDRLIFVSDGVYDVASAGGERYGERALARAINATRLLPAAQVPRAILQELAGHRHASGPEDDAMVLCLDWRGRDQAPAEG
ncbi:PP2C family protein-serine/threonine phosphatase [Actinosynnema sp. NPDC047251]|uniref:Protein serine/threonine phosphatase n=1 Tax=Saccharothrix espanaensis (strain ATCC 51144 / DSM 44229 / JCM 9112 / NBRC 15066 / NRRL 15764) TaxID=1179773 RepID=K0K6V9_SACES|nr:PP2C family protein-serine/threonine phosphatase [Saccharothrix espanaensis]CCH32609.1 Protein serine/threonine phosphatase [Saccharothrix espanaensis DSM 44229]